VLRWEFGWRKDFRNMQELEEKPSGWGIASVVLAILSVMTLGTLFFGLIAYVATTGADFDKLDDNSPPAIVIGFFFVLSSVLAVIGLILGFVGALQYSKKWLSVLGIGLNFLYIFAVTALLLIGLFVED
jgi:hypothetical protein